MRAFLQVYTADIYILSIAKFHPDWCSILACK